MARLRWTTNYGFDYDENIKGRVGCRILAEHSIVVAASGADEDR